MSVLKVLCFSKFLILNMVIVLNKIQLVCNMKHVQAVIPIFYSVISAKRVTTYSQFQVKPMVIVLKEVNIHSASYPIHVLDVTQMGYFVMNVWKVLLFLKFPKRVLAYVFLISIPYLVFNLKFV